MLVLVWHDYTFANIERTFLLKKPHKLLVRHYLSYIGMAIPWSHLKGIKVPRVWYFLDYVLIATECSSI